MNPNNEHESTTTWEPGWTDRKAMPFLGGTRKARQHFITEAYRQWQGRPEATVGDVVEDAERERTRLYKDSVDQQVTTLLQEAARIAANPTLTLQDVYDHALTLAQTYKVRPGTLPMLQQQASNLDNTYLKAEDTLLYGHVATRRSQNE